MACPEYYAEKCRGCPMERCEYFYECGGQACKNGVCGPHYRYDIPLHWVVASGTIMATLFAVILMAVVP